MCATHRLDESVRFPQLSALERSQVSQPPSGLVEEGASVIKARAGLPGGKLTLRVNLVLVEELELPAEAAELHWPTADVLCGVEGVHGGALADCDYIQIVGRRTKQARWPGHESSQSLRRPTALELVAALNTFPQDDI